MFNGLDDFNLADYQAWAETTAIYPDNIKILYPILGLVGETGEVVEKVLENIIISIDDSKISVEAKLKLEKAISALKVVAQLGKELEVLKKEFRKGLLGDGVSIIDNCTPESKKEISKELGDQMWYQAATATDLELGLQEVAQENHDKLESRKERNVLHGSGDNR